MQCWCETLSPFNSQKRVNCRMLKSTIEFKMYFSIHPCKYATKFCKYITSSTRVPVGRGAWPNIKRHCVFCACQDIGDEFQCLFKCPTLTDDRKAHLRHCFCEKNPNSIKLKFNILIKINFPVKKQCEITKYYTGFFEIYIIRITLI